jgi:hypothetical protein
MRCWNRFSIVLACLWYQNIETQKEKNLACFESILLKLFYLNLQRLSVGIAILLIAVVLM